MFKWNGVAEKEFVGLSNYVNLFTNDATFMIALKNNLVWIVLTIVLLMTVSLGFAVILNKQFRGRTVFRAFFYFPCVIAPIAVAIIWRWIYNPNIGFINQFFKVLGINFKQTWISDPEGEPVCNLCGSTVAGDRPADDPFPGRSSGSIPGCP